MTRLPPFVATGARWLARGLVRSFYSAIDVTHRELIPRAGPVLFVANHANSLMDPVIIGISAGRPVHFLAAAPLFNIPVFGPAIRAVGMLPAYRRADDPAQVGKNTESLGAAASCLARGQAVGIFPEGKSHDELAVEKVRSGAARIAWQAIQAGARGLQIVPVGINYQQKERFRSAVWVRVGAPIDADAWLRQHTGDERKAVRELTAEIERRLREVVIHLTEQKWEPFLGDLAELIPPTEEIRRGLAPALQQRKRIADAVNYFLQTSRPRTETMARDVEEHRGKLSQLGFGMDSDLFRYRGPRLVARQTWEIVWLAIGLVPAILGAVHNAVPYAVLRALALLIPKPGRMTVSLTKLGLGVPVFVAWYALVWFLMAGYFLPWVAWTWSGLMCLAGVFTLNYWPRAGRAIALWWNELRVWPQRDKLEELRRERAALKSKLHTFAEEYRRVAPPEPLPDASSRANLAAPRLILWSATFLIAAAVAWWSLSLLRQATLAELNGGPDLTHMAPDALEAQLHADETALRDLLASLPELERRTIQIRDEFASGLRTFYRQADDDAVRGLLLSYVNHRSALLRIIWRYQRHAGLKESRAGLRSFLAAFTAATALYEHSHRFIEYFEQDSVAVRKLNEAEPLWGIPSGLFSDIRRSLVNAEHRRLLDEAAKLHAQLQPQFDRHDLLTPAPYDAFHGAIKTARQPSLSASVTGRSMLLAAEETRELGMKTVYKAKSLVSAWIGDTKIRNPRGGQPLIQPEQVGQLRKMLRPGDIIIERRNWFLSNAFLPGYWPHAALYAGTADDLIALGLRDDPRVAKQWSAFVQKDAGGHEHVVIEAVSEGVVFTSLEHSIGGGDSVAVLRPRLDREQIREALARAFSHVGKPYDFDFDFFSSDKLVCTELVFRAYDGDIEFPLVNILGTRTMPAIELVRKCAAEQGTPRAQLEFVVFLDGSETRRRAVFKDEQAFYGTLSRPPLTWLQ